MDDRNDRWGARDYERSTPSPDYTRDYGSGRDYSYSNARDYAAAGELGYGRERQDQGRSTPSYRDDSWRGRSDYGAQDYGARDYDRGAWDRDRYQRGSDRGWGERMRGYAGYGAAAGGTRGQGERAGQDDDRGFLERAGDEVRSWFGDEEAERRREMDQRYDDRMARSERRRDTSPHDDHYRSWRSERIAELDRDYDEYRRENAQRFHNEFSSWRTERQGQRDCLRRVSEHMEVVGSDGSHVGTVDKVRGDRILLTKSDPEAGGHHHSIPSRWIDSVDDQVKLRKTADEAQAHWRDEERSGAFFGEQGETKRAEERQDWSSEHNLNRSFSGTY
ncbi:MAG: DUF2171 domain-containing protein [Sphingomonas sp.]|nr:DUF2171 domain-containing protein [Sphingomonas sp.]MBO9624380.1 DUF2171 domain-containing protein [Sphingomonas sp.]